MGTGFQKGMSLTNLLHWSYWLAITTPPFRRTALIVAVAVLILCGVVGVIFRVIARRLKSNPPLTKGLVRLSRPLLFLALTGLIWIWFRQLGAAILSARAWLFLIGLIAVVWVIWIIRSTRKTYHTELARLQDEKKYREYLPKRK